MKTIIVMMHLDSSTIEYKVDVVDDFPTHTELFEGVKLYDENVESRQGLASREKSAEAVLWNAAYYRADATWDSCKAALYKPWEDKLDELKKEGFSVEISCDEEEDCYYEKLPGGLFRDRQDSRFSCWSLWFYERLLEKPRL